ncbi:DUF1819 family protein [Lamprobacter modestohalophilus]|uniref:DUF1819 family protein n=1 Tax=Lamprobacter modestohalophilus TaxID=1064514 RepID=UPI002ADEEAF5|nr:DUF1819 family protein [Lamprobacter modestohalophilus]MEA1051423.1 DUF1819 family protein [Lamprobacter modestohalophilus]
MDGDRYPLSFTAAGLSRRESVQMANLFLEFGDWSVVRERMLDDNLLQVRTRSALLRIGREILSRLQQLDHNQLSLLVEANAQDQGYLLWLAVCRRYRFIADFAVDVLHERSLNLMTDLSHSHFDAFFNRKAEWHPELEQLANSTRLKIRQILFRLLREAGLLSATDGINPVMLSPAMLQTLAPHQRGELRYFPPFAAELERLAPIRDAQPG